MFSRDLFGFLVRRVFERFSCFSGVCSLCFRFATTPLFPWFLSFSRETDQANRTPHFPSHVSFVLFFFCFLPPPRFCCPPVFGRASFCFWRFVGVPFWAPGVFGILSVLVLRPFFLDARRHGFSGRSLFCRFLVPLFFVIAAHTLVARVGLLTEVGGKGFLPDPSGE